MTPLNCEPYFTLMRLFQSNSGHFRGSPQHCNLEWDGHNIQRTHLTWKVGSGGDTTVKARVQTLSTRTLGTHNYSQSA